MHAKSFADVVGKKPVALLFATPQLCQSRVCGPVVDVALQMKAKYGDRVEFIHQEVYEDNDPNKGLREPLQAFNLPTEPWLFVVGKDGRITARLEGSFGLGAFEQGAQDRTVITVFAHGLVQRSSLPIPEWLFGWAAAIVLCISFVALAALWPKPRLEHPGWRPLPGGRALGSRAVEVVGGVLGVAILALVLVDGLRRPADAAGQLRADLRLHHLLGRAGVRERAVRRPLPPLQPVAGDRAGAVPRPRAARLPGAARALARRDRPARSSRGSSSPRAGASTPRRSRAAVAGYSVAHARGDGASTAPSRGRATGRRSRSTSTSSRACRCSRRATAWSACGRSSAACRAWTRSPARSRWSS